MNHSKNLWWRSAVIYQIYPRSFYDSNNDGIGDLKGILAKLPYLASLGIDAIWISPFLQSPQKDFGYDVADYYAIDPRFGTMYDLDALITACHAVNIKVIMDQVINHTSAEHAWFQVSRQNKTNAKANWYVWANAKTDGSPPNNWLSVFGGSAWEWDTTRQQYYLHNFLASQPDLNFHNPEVVDAVLAVLCFWLEKGIDGFRLDCVNFYVHDKELHDNPWRAVGEPLAEGVPADNPYAKQYHLYDKTQPENFAVLKRIRQLLNQYPGTVTMGEIGDDNSLITSAQYVQGNEHLHMVYNFRFLDLADNFSPKLILPIIQELETYIGDGWPCWALGNHDVARIASRLAHGKPSNEYSKLLMALLLSLRGTVCIYQGEELGLLEAEVPYEKMQDPYGLRFYPIFKGRDGCRTPLPWDHRLGGFSNAEPWLPLYQPHLQQAIDLQETDKNSILHHYRSFLRWRKTMPALCLGNIRLLMADDNLLAFERYNETQQILIIFNFSDEEKGLYNMHPAIEFNRYRLLEGHGFQAKLNQTSCSIPAFSALFAEHIK
jgi:alpha-glucosidase